MTDLRGRGGWEQSLAPRALLLGCVLSFLACCAAGRVASRTDFYRDFHRFHSFLNFESLYFPTASQTRTLARARLAPDHIAVVVGGSSVVYGFSQTPEYLWTERLQELLGDRYRVFNFALPGGTSAEFGAVAAEVLERDHPRVIFVTDTWPGTGSWAGEVDGGRQRYFFWDAYYKGLLVPGPEREARLAELAREKEGNSAYAELKRGARLDAWLYAQDLWTALAYRHASTVWCPLVARSVTRARRRYADPDAVAPLAHRYPAALDPVLMPLTRAHVARRWPGTPAPAPGADYGDTPLVKSFRLCFPPAARRRTLVLVDHVSPHYTKRLPPDLQARHAEDFPESVRALEQAGFAAVEVGRGYTELDYNDMTHVSAEGAPKMAAEVTPKVRELARRLGYLGDVGEP